LKVTGRFYDYFDVTAEEVKKKLEGGEEVKNES